MGRQPFSLRTAAVHSRLRGSEHSRGVCPFCAVGCSQDVYSKDGVLIAVEGDSESPINEGRLCPKGASTLQFAQNGHRLTRVMHRAPGADHWEAVSADWAIDRIAELLKQARDEDFVETNAQGASVNSLKSVAVLGGTAQDNEEAYLIKKLFTGGLGVVPVENQARF